jgi:hypothetical protein
MFGRKKKTPDYPDEGLLDAIRRVARDEADKRIDAKFYLSEPEISLHRATKAPVETRECGNYATYYEFVDTGRWYAKIDGGRVMGTKIDGERIMGNVKLDAASVVDYSTRYEGFASAAAAENAAREWYESKPTVRVK